MISVKRVSIMMSVIAIILLVVIHQQATDVKSQIKATQTSIQTAKKTKKQQVAMIEKPANQEKVVQSMTKKVSTFTSQFLNENANDYDNLQSYASSQVIKTLKTDLAPSVTFAKSSKYDIKKIALQDTYATQLNYLVIAKSDVQTVVYTMTVDSELGQVTQIARYPLKGGL